MISKGHASDYRMEIKQRDKGRTVLYMISFEEQPTIPAQAHRKTGDDD